ncbi:hypothetical protein Pan241w_51250 [Gimesia alba]|uniref:Polyketide cyclase / dehydrase and lipid transport n=1 Tax=Gimesia alba TaxID=2527973 RepID=A0A517RM91_9PLAN|nr:SRPBCC family protein [Gimesia alba]QDT45008.1 hypothetical protein Pan241w_51250 [Gimesia alba]
MQLELTEKIKLDAPSEIIHDWLSNLENWPKINEKIRSIAVDGNKCIGQLEFKGRTVDFAGMVPEDNDPSNVICNIVVQADEKLKEPEHFSVIYEITPKGSQTQVIERIIFEKEIPFWGWLLIKLIMKLGKPTGLTNLQQIKEHINTEEGSD